MKKQLFLAVSAGLLGLCLTHTALATDAILTDNARPVRREEPVRLASPEKCI